MKSAIFRLLLALVAAAATAHAHPGHGDHDFGWDFTAAASHPWSATQVMGLGCLLAMVIVLFWNRRSSRN